MNRGWTEGGPRAERGWNEGGHYLACAVATHRLYFAQVAEEVKVQDDTPTAEMLDEMIADINSFDENDEDLFAEV